MAEADPKARRNSPITYYARYCSIVIPVTCFSRRSRISMTKSTKARSQRAGVTLTPCRSHSSSPPPRLFPARPATGVPLLRHAVDSLSRLTASVSGPDSAAGGPEPPKRADDTREQTLPDEKEHAQPTAAATLAAAVAVPSPVAPGAADDGTPQSVARPLENGDGGCCVLVLTRSLWRALIYGAASSPRRPPSPEELAAVRRLGASIQAPPPFNRHLPLTTRGLCELIVRALARFPLSERVRAARTEPWEGKEAGRCCGRSRIVGVVIAIVKSSFAISNERMGHKGHEAQGKEASCAFSLLPCGRVAEGRWRGPDNTQPTIFLCFSRLFCVHATVLPVSACPPALLAPDLLRADGAGPRRAGAHSQDAHRDRRLAGARASRTPFYPLFSSSRSTTSMYVADDFVLQIDWAHRHNQGVSTPRTNHSR